MAKPVASAITQDDQFVTCFEWGIAVLITLLMTWVQVDMWRYYFAQDGGPDVVEFSLSTLSSLCLLAIVLYTIVVWVRAFLNR